MKTRQSFVESDFLFLMLLLSLRDSRRVPWPEIKYHLSP